MVSDEEIYERAIIQKKMAEQERGVLLDEEYLQKAINTIKKQEGYFLHKRMSSSTRNSQEILNISKRLTSKLKKAYGKYKSYTSLTDDVIQSYVNEGIAETIKKEMKEGVMSDPNFNSYAFMASFNKIKNALLNEESSSMMKIPIIRKSNSEKVLEDKKDSLKPVVSISSMDDMTQDYFIGSSESLSLLSFGGNGVNQIILQSVLDYISKTRVLRLFFEGYKKKQIKNILGEGIARIESSLKEEVNGLSKITEVDPDYLFLFINTYATRKNI